jgi:arylsulfatase A-like enzyme
MPQRSADVDASTTRRSLVKSAVAAGVSSLTSGIGAAEAATPAAGGPPNILYFLADNLGYGELGCYGGGVLRGVDTARLDAFAKEGVQLLNFAPEAQCTPSRSALMTGRYAIRSGTHTVALAGSPGGLVTWERTMGDVLSDAGYATAIYGKWHLGDTPGRFPTDHGFDEWLGIPRTYDESLWPDDPRYDPARDGVTRVLDGRKGQGVQQREQLTLDVRRNIDRQYLDRAKAFMQRSVAAGTPFYLYFNHSMMHLPTVPRDEFKGKTGNGDFADSLLELDTDFGELLDTLDALGVANNTVVVFSGDNGPEEAEPWRGTAGYWEGSYFTGMEGSLRTPCLIRYPNHVPAGGVSNEIVHITDMHPTLLGWAGAPVPTDRVIDGLDQRAFFEGKQDGSAREGFPYWLGPTLFGVKWRNFKLKLMQQTYLTQPALQLPNPHLINLIVDPKERKPLDYPYLHSWVNVHIGKILADFEASTKHEPLIPAGAPLNFVPGR